MNCELSVNVDHVATLRQARGGEEPDPVRSAVMALDAGAEGITVHLREDRRHIQDRDVANLKAVGRGVFNLEMALTDEMVGIALVIRPDRVTLVPEHRAELTTEGGLNLKHEIKVFTSRCRRLVDGGIPVSLFLDPVEELAPIARDVAASFIEIHTGHYANARGADRVDHELSRIASAARRFANAGFHVHAGHGLNVGNVTALLHRHPFGELAIGHSIVSRAVEVGMTRAVHEMIAAIRAA
ncbi:MAG: pyridoxine 5'-phosphate synthase [Candidatus Eiseniibacteriota bacterium]